jgi:hypothetical protein
MATWASSMRRQSVRRLRFEFMLFAFCVAMMKDFGCEGGEGALTELSRHAPSGPERSVGVAGDAVAGDAPAEERVLVCGMGGGGRGGVPLWGRSAFVGSRAAAEAERGRWDLHPSGMMVVQVCPLILCRG